MQSLAEQIRELSLRLARIQEGEFQPDQSRADFDRQMAFIKQNGSGAVLSKVPELKPAGSPNFYTLSTTDGQTVWVYGTKVDPECTEPVSASLNGRPVTVMKLPGVHADHESRGYIAR
jgi:hypothetical protein